jgi:predicted  nucleic acid-binding Zn-ribbon protein
MHPDIEKLMNLQRYDLEVKRLRDEMTALPRQVSLLEQKAKATAGQRGVVIDLIAKEEVLRRGHEMDVRDRQDKIARVRKQLDQATSTVQVNAFEHELAFLQNEVSKLEDAELLSMERSEELEKQKLVADEAVTVAERKHVLERERALTTIGLNKVALVDVEARRATARAQIGEDMLSLYDRIAKSKGTALAEAVLQKCSACQMLLRPQRWNELRERDNHEMLTCESCGRLLFYDPARDSPQRKVVPFESIAAQIVRRS